MAYILGYNDPLGATQGFDPNAARPTRLAGPLNPWAAALKPPPGISWDPNAPFNSPGNLAFDKWAEPQEPAPTYIIESGMAGTAPAKTTTGLVAGNLGLAPTAGGPTAPPFNINPPPQQGSGTFGAVPGPIGMPNPYGDLSGVYGNLPQTNAAASGDILSKLSGQLSPNTVNAIQDAAAKYGVRSGQGPGGGLQLENFLENVGSSSEAQQQQGIQDYNQTLPTVSSTQTVSPNLQTEIAQQNSVNAAAPNPADAASYASALFDKYLAAMKSPAGGTGSFGGGLPTGPGKTRPGTQFPGIAPGGGGGSMSGLDALGFSIGGSPYTSVTPYPGFGVGSGYQSDVAYGALGSGAAPTYQDNPMAYDPLSALALDSSGNPLNTGGNYDNYGLDFGGF